MSISEKKKRLKALVGPAIALSSINWILQTSDVNKVDVIDKPLLLLTCSSLAHFGTSAARWLSCLKPKKQKADRHPNKYFTTSGRIIGSSGPLIDAAIPKCVNAKHTASVVGLLAEFRRFQLCQTINFKLPTRKAMAASTYFIRRRQFNLRQLFK